MRNFCLSVLGILLSGIFQLQAQQHTPINPYLLDSFVDGALYYQGKPPKVAKFNYHLVGQEIVMDFNDQKVPVNNFPNLDSVRIADHVFILIDAKSYEQLVPGSIQLLLDHRHSSQEEAAEGLYGTRSHTQGVIVANKTVKKNDFYSLEWQEGYQLVNRSEFYIAKEGELTKFSNANQLAQIFKDKKKEIKDFANQNKIDFSDPKQVVTITYFVLKN